MLLPGRLCSRPGQLLSRLKRSYLDERKIKKFGAHDQTIWFAKGIVSASTVPFQLIDKSINYELRGLCARRKLGYGSLSRVDGTVMRIFGQRRRHLTSLISIISRKVDVPES